MAYSFFGGPFPSLRWFHLNTGQVSTCQWLEGTSLRFSRALSYVVPSFWLAFLPTLALLAAPNWSLLPQFSEMPDSVKPSPLYTAHWRLLQGHGVGQLSVSLQFSPFLRDLTPALTVVQYLSTFLILSNFLIV